MFREKIPARQLSAWMFAVIVPVGLQLLSGCDWVWIGGAGTVGVVLTWLLWRKPQEPKRFVCVLLFIYVTVLTGEMLHRTAQSWPVGNSDPAIPLILLALAAWSAQKGPSAAARAGAVLFWLVLVLYLAVFAAGIKDVRVQWLVPQWEVPDTLGMIILLIPCAAIGMLREPGTPGKRIWLSMAFLLAGSIITVGVLSPSLSYGLNNAFYELSRSLELFGAARRFEALICAGATVGWFALLSALLTLSGLYTQKIFPGYGREGVWLASGGAALWKLCGLHIEPTFLLLAGTVFWVAAPLSAQGLGKIKKS